jgi:hypothetical protein
VCSENGRWIELAQDHIRRWALVVLVLNFRVFLLWYKWRIIRLPHNSLFWYKDKITVVCRILSIVRGCKKTEWKWGHLVLINYLISSLPVVINFKHWVLMESFINQVERTHEKCTTGQGSNTRTSAVQALASSQANCMASTRCNFKLLKCVRRCYQILTSLCLFF